MPVTTPEADVQRTAVDRTAEFSDEVLRSVESGQRAAIKAVRNFADAVDGQLPSLANEHPTKRQEIIDAAMEMADQLVHTEYAFLREITQSAGKAVGRADEGN